MSSRPPEQEAFLQAILAAPDDDAPRLVYADWLEEHGATAAERARAEFIRGQIELAALGPPRGPARVSLSEFVAYGWIKLRLSLSTEEPRRTLEDRQKELLRAHGGRWAAQLFGLVDEVWFARGFPEEVRLLVLQFCRHGEELLSRAPILRVRVNRPHCSVSPREVSELTSCSHLGRVRALILSETHLGDDGLRELVSSPHLRRLAELHLVCNALTARGMEALAESPHLAGLRSLELGANRIGDEGLATIARATSLPRLSHLKVSSNHVGDVGVMALAASPHFPELRSLWLIHNQFTDAGLAALAESPHLENLEVLAIFGNRFDRRRWGFKALHKRFGKRLLAKYHDMFR